MSKQKNRKKYAIKSDYGMENASAQHVIIIQDAGCDMEKELPAKCSSVGFLLFNKWLNTNWVSDAGWRGKPDTAVNMVDLGIAPVLCRQYRAWRRTC